jgi:hypothetical protein
MKAFIDDCDCRTELAKKHLAETQEELSAEVASKAEKVHKLAEAIERNWPRPNKPAQRERLVAHLSKVPGSNPSSTFAECDNCCVRVTV